MAYTSEQIKQIYGGLHKFRGSIKEVADRCNRRPYWVYLVMTEQYADDKLIEVAATVWAELEEKAAKKRGNVADIVAKANKFANLNLVPA